MNRIKYINPRSGQTAVVKVCQPSSNTLADAHNRRHWGGSVVVTMASADAYMTGRGFVRAGRRWAKATARVTLRAAAIKNALTDNATLATR